MLISAASLKFPPNQFESGQCRQADISYRIRNMIICASLIFVRKWHISTFFTEKFTFHRDYRYIPTIFFTQIACIELIISKMGVSLVISPILTEIWPYVQVLFSQKMTHLNLCSTLRYYLMCRPHCGSRRSHHVKIHIFGPT